MTIQPERFMSIVSCPDAEINLAEAALVIASDEYSNLDIESYLARFDELARTLRNRLRPDIGQADTIIALNRYLFEEHGFSGNHDDYHDPRNSFLNDVLDRKRGIPITLALVYMEIGRRIGLPVEGVSFPSHFLVKCPLREGTVVLDPYAKGISLGVEDLKRRLKKLRDGVEPSRAEIARLLVAASHREILVRLLRNLKGIYWRRKEWRKALTVMDRIITATPDMADGYRDRGLVYLKLECFRGALFDLQAYLAMLPEAHDGDSIRTQVLELQKAAAKLN